MGSCRSKRRVQLGCRPGRRNLASILQLLDDAEEAVGPMVVAHEDSAVDLDLVELALDGVALRKRMRSFSIFHPAVCATGDNAFDVPLCKVCHQWRRHRSPCACSRVSCQPSASSAREAGATRRFDSILPIDLPANGASRSLAVTHRATEPNGEQLRSHRGCGWMGGVGRGAAG